MLSAVAWRGVEYSQCLACFMSLTGSFFAYIQDGKRPSLAFLERLEGEKVVDLLVCLPRGVGLDRVEK
tara:strand:+ start:1630 stop:1833 length:204 start_codon:yes stop_codon:yes gene_type:complete